MHEVCERPDAGLASTADPVSLVGSAGQSDPGVLRWQRVPVGDEWLELAGCRDVPTGMFFSEKDEETSEALRVCAQCSVRRACLEYAIENRICDGIWGGASERGRRSIQRARKAADRDPDPGRAGRRYPPRVGRW